MTNYFRITGYLPEQNISFVMDSYGAYEKLWQFSSELLRKGCKILFVGNSETFSDGTIPKLSAVSKKPALRAIVSGTPAEESYTVNGNSYSAIRIGDKVYIPDITKLSR